MRDGSTFWYCNLNAQVVLACTHAIDPSNGCKSGRVVVRCIEISAFDRQKVVVRMSCADQLAKSLWVCRVGVMCERGVTVVLAGVSF